MAAKHLPKTEDYFAISVLFHGGETISIRFAYVIRLLADIAMTLDRFCGAKDLNI